MYRLIYKSRSRGDIQRDTVRDILHKSMELNREAGLTGVLLATDTHFMQVLEGEFGPLNSTFFRIASDSRHDNIQLVSYGPAEKRLFQDWVMRGFGVFDLNRDLEKSLVEKYGKEGESVRFPTEEWAALALVFDIRMMQQGVLE